MPRLPAKLSIITSEKKSKEPRCRSWHKTINSFHIPLHGYQTEVVLGSYRLLQVINFWGGGEKLVKMMSQGLTKAYVMTLSKGLTIPYLDISDSLVTAVPQSFTFIFRWESNVSMPTSMLTLVHRNL